MPCHRACSTTIDRLSWPPAPKDVWGPCAWNALHSFAILFPLRPTYADRVDAYQRIWAFVTHLPCPECQAHATRYVLANPPDLVDTHSLQGWVWSFHNAVNARLGKRLIDFDEYMALYSEELRARWGGMPLYE
jgi:hypothetical protein